MIKTFFISISLLVPSMASALTAREIIDASIHLDSGKSAEARVQIKVTEADGKSKMREMLLRRRTLNGSEQTRVDFTSPADIKGLALLIIETPGGDTEQHLYTPALRRIRRIRGSLKSQEFADTDFSYEDMERRNLDDADYDLDGEETLEGRVCYRIMAKTKKHVRSQYGRTISWIDKETFLFRKLELYDRSGKEIKRLRSLKSEQISGVWTQLSLTMENIEKKRMTSYDVSKITYGVSLDSSLFTTTALGQ